MTAFFPTRTPCPKGGLGNLIALPLQKLPRANGNSVFVDAEFRPYPDQWEFLASVKRMPADAVEAVVLEAQRSAETLSVSESALPKMKDIDPWTLPPSRKRAERQIPGPFPAQVRIVRAESFICREKWTSFRDVESAASPWRHFRIPNSIKPRLCGFPLSTSHELSHVAKILANHIALPRGCIAEVMRVI